MTLRGQRALVTGATSGIGEAVARRLAADGCDLTLLARREERLNALEDELAAKHGVVVDSLPVDVRDLAALRGVARSHPDVFSRVDVLVNNAGLARGTDTVQEGREEDWEEMIDTNVKGLLHVTRAVLPHMVARGRGHVVNIGSTAGHWVYRGGAVYCATKHAVRAINEALRLDVHGTGVRVSSVDPGLVHTDFSLVRFRGDAARADAVYANTQPLTADDVADAVHWVLSRPARVNVQEIVLFPTAQASVRDVLRTG